MKVAFCFLMCASTAIAAEYNVTWRGDRGEWKAVVDTTTDMLTVTEWNMPEIYFEPMWSEFPRPWTMTPYTTGDDGLVQYDIPDEWDGVIDESWGFSAPHARGPDTNGIGGDADSAEMHKLRWYGTGTWTMNYWRLNDLGPGNLVGDMTPTYIDVSPLVNRVLGDSNLDGEFSSSDFVQVLMNGKYQTGLPADWAQGDWDMDGLFDSGDFVTAMLAGTYDAPRTVAATAAVPEPAGVVLLVLGTALAATTMRLRY